MGVQGESRGGGCSWGAASRHHTQCSVHRTYLSPRHLAGLGRAAKSPGDPGKERGFPTPSA